MTIQKLLTRTLIYGAVFAVAVAVVAGLIGLAAAGVGGLVAGLLGAALAAVFLGLTAASILLAGRVAGDDLTSVSFFAVVLGVWFAKLVIFLGVLVWLRGQPWLDPWVFFVSVIVAVIGSLVIDAAAFQRSRLPYVDERRTGR